MSVVLALLITLGILCVAVTLDTLIKGWVTVNQSYNPCLREHVSEEDIHKQGHA